MLLSIRDESQRTGWFGWAAFLGISWTWCIGMFLPVILIRDFGNAGFWIFAIPNVIGAAAMAWVLRSPEQSRSLVADHRLACEIFSAVTIAFHLYFVFAILPMIVHQTIGPWSTVAGIAIVLLLLMPRVRWLDRAAAIIVFAISLAAFGVFTKVFAGDSSLLVRHEPTVRGIEIAGLTSVCVLGFFTCPYLDLTFHRAAQNSRNSRASFSVGFGLIFFAMILFTFVYAHTNWRMLPPLLLSVLGAHLMVQSGFTIAAHARELSRRSTIAWGVALLLAACSIIFVKFGPQGLPGQSRTVQELVYRCFMGFYGLIAPAYVWLVITPHVSIGRRWTIFLTVIVIALPAYVMGFLVEQYAWLLLGVGLVVLPRGVLVGKSKEVPRTTAI